MHACHFHLTRRLYACLSPLHGKATICVLVKLRPEDVASKINDEEQGYFLLNFVVVTILIIKFWDKISKINNLEVVTLNEFWEVLVIN